ncbi:glycosyltransferase family 4 protein [Candidatus Gottesmanbacteria bacterium]|nr:glycosyltransferase family 4 protein [Candidatus Gottesmanbacteria bacterium]
MRILILNWRDIKNPAGGGAERLTHELAKRWVIWGHSVTVFCAGYRGSLPDEYIDGVRIFRRGRWWNVHALAVWYYFFRFKKATDVVIDEVHWYPFFAVFYAGNKTVLLACEVAKKLFPVLFPKPLAALGRWIERIYFYLYRNVPTITISKSTKDDLIAEGFNDRGITVIPLGVDMPRHLPKTKKENNPTLVYLGRINKQKGTEDALLAFDLVKNHFPEANFWVIGEGPIKSHWRKNSVRFFGKVSETKKFSFLAKAHLLLFPSIHEGWGLVVSEAGLVRTPTIAYNVSGVRDVVMDGTSGILTAPNPDSLAREAIRVLQDKKLYRVLQMGALVQAKRRSWNLAARKALGVLLSV